MAFNSSFKQDGGAYGGSMLKEAIARRGQKFKRSEQNHLKYMDSMQELSLIHI